jgi:hypothetical protein
MCEDGASEAEHDGAGDGVAAPPATDRFPMGGRGLVQARSGMFFVSLSSGRVWLLAPIMGI